VALIVSLGIAALAMVPVRADTKAELDQARVDDVEPPPTGVLARFWRRHSSGGGSEQ